MKEETFMTEQTRLWAAVTEFSYSEITLPDDDDLDNAVDWCRARFGDPSHQANGKTSWNALSGDVDGTVTFVFGKQIPESDIVEFKLLFG